MSVLHSNIILITRRNSFREHALDMISAILAGCDGTSRINTVDDFAKKVGSRPQSRDSDRLKRTLACIGRLLFTHRLEIGLGVTAVAAPFVRPTIATKPSEVVLKAAGLFLVLAGLAVRVWGAGFAGSAYSQFEN